MTLSTPVDAPNTPAPSQRWMPGIEMLRGIAAVVVVAHHAWSLSTLPRFPGYWLIEGFGSYGVDIFFVLSAFLLSDPSWRITTKQQLATFWARRAARIIPAYYAVVIVLFLFFVPSGVLFTGTGLRQILANLTFTQYLFPTTSSSFGTNGVLWTLSIEFMLYLMLPIIGWLFVRAPAVTFAVMVAIGVGWRVVIGVAGHGLREFYFDDLAVPVGLQSLFVARQFVGYLPLFAIGMAARWLCERHATLLERRVRSAGFWTIMALLVPGALYLRVVERSSQYTHWVWFASFDTIIALLVVPAMVVAAFGDVSSSRSDRLGAWLGARSYGIYLWHFPVILVAYERGSGFAPPVVSNIWARILFIIALTALLADMSYRLIEMPAQRWMRARTLALRTS
jgi:peptidoglycan/LPS O-acetylase OafA/YrhL